MTDTTVIQFPNTGGYLLQKWNIKCNDKNNSGKIQNFIRSSKSQSPTSNSGASSLPPVGHTFMYVETSSNNHGDGVFVSWERTDIIQITNITFYYNRFSAHNPSMGRFRIQLLIKDNTWSTVYTIEKDTQYSDLETDWKLLNIKFTIENYGINLIYDQIDTPHADMCFSNFSITHSVY